MASKHTYQKSLNTKVRTIRRPATQARPCEAYVFFACWTLLNRCKGSLLYLAYNSLLKVSKCFRFFSFCFSLHRGRVLRAWRPQWIVKIGDRTLNWYPMRNISYTWWKSFNQFRNWIEELLFKMYISSFYKHYLGLIYHSIIVHFFTKPDIQCGKDYYNYSD